MQTDPGDKAGKMSPRPRADTNLPEEGGLPFQRVKAFSNTDLYLGHRKQHVGMNKEKKRSCLVSVCDICLGEESAELIGNPIVETLTSQL